MDRTVPAMLSPPPCSPPPSWSCSPLLSEAGRVRGIRIRRRVMGSSHLPSRPLSPRPASSVRPHLVRTFVRSVCPVCGRRLRCSNSNADNNIEYCSRCLTEIFPFNAITNDRKFKEAINGFSINRRHLIRAETMRFNPLDVTVKEVLTDLNETIGGCKYLS